MCIHRGEEAPFRVWMTFEAVHLALDFFLVSTLYWRMHLHVPVLSSYIQVLALS